MYSFAEMIRLMSMGSKILLFFFSLICVCSCADEKINLADYGIVPDTGKDMTVRLQEVFGELSGSGHGIELDFAPGRYDFYPDSVLMSKDDQTVLLNIVGKKNIVLDGNGAEFIFHGRIAPFYLNGSESIHFKNITIDWEVPYNAQATVLQVTDDYVDLQIDTETYPFSIVEDKFVFEGEYHPMPVCECYANLFDGRTHDIVYRTRDMALGRELFTAPKEMLDENTVRVHYHSPYKAEPGTILLFHLATYLSNGFWVEDCEDFSLENMTFYHTLSCALYAIRTHDIGLKNVKIISNEEKGRVFSTIADATHYIGCTGTILYDGCEFSGSGDDGMNIHGMYMPVSEIVDDNTVRIVPTSRDAGVRKGEKIWVVDTLSMQRMTEFDVCDMKRIAGTRDYLIVFDEDISGFIKAGDILENASANPSLIVRNCRFLKKNRARSILVTTPEKVLIENNYFNTSGAAILIEGDIRLWYESGGIKDVTVRNNVFENCYSSGDNITDAPWGWGEGVISLSPSFLPTGPDDGRYHRNISIENNIFKQFDYNVLFARSVDGIRFVNNELIRTYDYEPYYRPYTFTLDGCRNVTIRNNHFSDDFLGKNALLMHMSPEELDQDNIKVTVK